MLGNASCVLQMISDRVIVLEAAQIGQTSRLDAGALACTHVFDTGTNKDSSMGILLAIAYFRDPSLVWEM